MKKFYYRCAICLLLCSLRVWSVIGATGFKVESVEEWKNLLPNVVRAANVPDAINWCDLNGTNYCSPVQNQHVPKYCGSCFLFSSTSAWSDRANINNSPGSAPMLSVQAGLNCMEFETCFTGGDAGLVYDFMKKEGLPDVTCNPYVAEGSFECTDENICYTNWPEKGKQVIKEFKKYFVEDYGIVYGEDAMKAEIATRGPIACSIASDPLDDYSSTDVYSDGGDHWIPDHWIEVVGYGIVGSKPYWLVKNSWGTAWNLPMEGYVKLGRGDNTLGVEDFCFWAVPSKL